MYTKRLERTQQILALAAQGMQAAIIAKTVGCHPLVVYRATGDARERGEAIPKHAPRPLSERDMRILEKARAGMPPRDIAAEVGCLVGSVCNVLAKARGRGEVIPRGKRGPKRSPAWAGDVDLDYSDILKLSPMRRAVALCAFRDKAAKDGASDSSAAE